MEYYLLAAIIGYIAGMGTITWVLTRRKKAIPQLVGASLPKWNAPIDLSKTYDIDLLGRHNGAPERPLLAVRILGFLNSDWDEAAGGYAATRWLVIESPDGRKVYIKPNEVHRLQEADPVSRPIT